MSFFGDFYLAKFILEEGDQKSLLAMRQVNRACRKAADSVINQLELPETKTKRELRCLLREICRKSSMISLGKLLKKHPKSDLPYTTVLVGACKANNLELVKFVIDYWREYISRPGEGLGIGVYITTLYNHKKLFQFLRNQPQNLHGFFDNEYAIKGACNAKHVKLIDYILKKFQKEWTQKNQVLHDKFNAADYSCRQRGCNCSRCVRDISHRINEHGGKLWAFLKIGMFYAGKSGQIEIVNRMITICQVLDRGKLSEYYQKVVHGASYIRCTSAERTTQCISIINMMWFTYSVCSISFRYVISIASQNADMVLINHILGLYQDQELNESGLNGAGTGGHLDIVKFWAERGATQFDCALSSCEKDISYEMARYLIETKGADLTPEDIYDPLTFYCDCQRWDVVKLCINAGQTECYCGKSPQWHLNQESESEPELKKRRTDNS